MRQLSYRLHQTITVVNGFIQAHRSGPYRDAADRGKSLPTFDSVRRMIGNHRFRQSSALVGLLLCAISGNPDNNQRRIPTHSFMQYALGMRRLLSALSSTRASAI